MTPTPFEKQAVNPFQFIKNIANTGRRVWAGRPPRAYVANSWATRHPIVAGTAGAGLLAGGGASIYNSLQHPSGFAGGNDPANWLGSQTGEGLGSASSWLANAPNRLRESISGPPGPPTVSFADFERMKNQRNQFEMERNQARAQHVAAQEALQSGGAGDALTQLENETALGHAAESASGERPVPAPSATKGDGVGNWLWENKLPLGLGALGLYGLYRYLNNHDDEEHRPQYAQPMPPMLPGPMGGGLPSPVNYYKFAAAMEKEAWPSMGGVKTLLQRAGAGVAGFARTNPAAQKVWQFNMQHPTASKAIGIGAGGAATLGGLSMLPRSTPTAAPATTPTSSSAPAPSPAPEPASAAGPATPTRDFFGDLDSSISGYLPESVQPYYEQLKNYGQQAWDYTKANPYLVGGGALSALALASLLHDHRHRDDDEDPRYYKHASVDVGAEKLAEQFPKQIGFLASCYDQGLTPRAIVVAVQKAASANAEEAANWQAFFQQRRGALRV